MKRVLRITVNTAERATRKANENSGQTEGSGFTLKGVKQLINSERQTRIKARAVGKQGIHCGLKVVV